MHVSGLFQLVTTLRPARRAGGLLALLVLLGACDRQAPTSLPAQAAVAEHLEAAHQHFADPATAALEQSCDTAPAFTQALEAWIQSVELAGLQSRFGQQLADAQRRAAALRIRCPGAPGVATAPAHRVAPHSDRIRDVDVAPVLSADLLDAYARGLDEEIALMRASGSHFVSLSTHDVQGRQVAEAAGLTLPDPRPPACPPKWLSASTTHWRDRACGISNPPAAPWNPASGASSSRCQPARRRPYRTGAIPDISSG